MSPRRTVHKPVILHPERFDLSLRLPSDPVECRAGTLELLRRGLVLLRFGGGRPPELLEGPDLPGRGVDSGRLGAGGSAGVELDRPLELADHSLRFLKFLREVWSRSAGLLSIGELASKRDELFTDLLRLGELAFEGFDRLRVGVDGFEILDQVGLGDFELLLEGGDERTRLRQGGRYLGEVGRPGVNLGGKVGDGRLEG